MLLQITYSSVISALAKGKQWATAVEVQLRMHSTCPAPMPEMEELTPACTTNQRPRRWRLLVACELTRSMKHRPYLCRSSNTCKTREWNRMLSPAAGASSAVSSLQASSVHALQSVSTQCTDSHHLVMPDPADCLTQASSALWSEEVSGVWPSSCFSRCVQRPRPGAKAAPCGSCSIFDPLSQC